MEKVFLDITDRAFAENAAPGYDLSLLAGTDGLSFLAAHAGSGEVLALKSWTFLNPQNRFREVESALRKILASETKIGMAYGKVRCAVFNNLVSLTPSRLFNPNDLPAYFNLLLRPGASLSYFYDDLPEFDAKLVFAVDADVARLCGQYFPQQKIFHASGTLLKSWHRLARRSDCDVFVNLRNQIAQIAVFDRKHLLYFNTFAWSKPSDFLYFALLAYEQQRLNPAEIPLTVSGELMEDSEIFRLLYRYVRHLKFAQLPDYYRFPGAVQALPAHFNFDLFSLKLA